MKGTIVKWNANERWTLWVIAGLGVVCFCFFQLLYPYHFFFKGQNQLFLISWSYVSTMFAKPAWAACLAGEFLTQFYYYEFAGAAILTASLVILYWLAYLALSTLKLGSLKFGRWIVLAVALAITIFPYRWTADVSGASQGDGI